MQAADNLRSTLIAWLCVDMPKYKVEVNWGGYSRGTSVWEVEAENEEEADEMYFMGKRVEHKVVRDDTEGEVESVSELNT